MATLTVRKLDDDVYERLRRRAEATGRSLEAFARDVLTSEVKAEDARAYVQSLREQHRAFVGQHGYLPDSTALIRQMRDEE